MSDMERQELVSGLKKYCELDTLAMVMIWEHLGGYRKDALIFINRKLEI
jgi:hypothetical protein